MKFAYKAIRTECGEIRLIDLQRPGQGERYDEIKDLAQSTINRMSQKNMQYDLIRIDSSLNNKISEYYERVGAYYCRQNNLESRTE